MQNQSEQKDYDSYNSLIFSTERNILCKALTRHNIYNSVKTIPGDIVECGVFKGSGMALWLKMMDLYEPHSLGMVIGFDFFGKDVLDSLQEDKDKFYMEKILSRVDESDLDIQAVESKLQKLAQNPTKKSHCLIKGDAVKTSAEFASDNPGWKIKLLYLDMDLGEPTKKVLDNLWSRITKGGVVVLDEYAYKEWSESVGVDEWIANKPEAKLVSTGVKAPTALIYKT